MYTYMLIVFLCTCFNTAKELYSCGNGILVPVKTSFGLRRHKVDVDMLKAVKSGG